ncbi:hypothetical protein [Actinoplanes sp. N902-109]|uniref:hypothetical protein n=1 Tax=Actinoplanes sp. (strain N902-109) TaxID=649831 RepID=UPI00032947CE|nr:hypothetical protein [Actinoplanes sp. N902-109]AGL17679.1 hypothetical protein L083_4169 [Actinoplanes sp. N902-109]
MARIDLTGDTLVVTVEGLDRLWALKSSLTIPLAHVRGATHDPGIVREPKGVRAPGTHVPGVLVAGTFHTEGERVFWAVHDPAKALVIELTDERYARLVVEVDDPRGTADRIARSLPLRSGG